MFQPELARFRAENIGVSFSSAGVLWPLQKKIIAVSAGAAHAKCRHATLRFSAGGDTMQHRTLEEVGQIATVSPVGKRMSRRERLERWATALERLDRKPLRSLMRIEFMTEDERRLLREENTPLSVAYEDPILREEGLASDRYGDSIAFFELTREEAHYLVCDCHYHGSMTAGEVAGRVRSVARRFSVREFWSRAFTGG